MIGVGASDSAQSRDSVVGRGDECVGQREPGEVLGGVGWLEEESSVHCGDRGASSEYDCG